MATPTWPTSIKRPVMSAYKYDPEKAFIRSDMEAGPAKQRRRFTQVPTKIGIKLILTLAEFDTFQTFWVDQLLDGAKWFTMPLVDGQGESTTNARFIEPYKAKADAHGLMWTVTGTVEIV